MGSVIYSILWFCLNKGMAILRLRLAVMAGYLFVREFFKYHHVQEIYT
jgi:hypothetical protein